MRQIALAAIAIVLAATRLAAGETEAERLFFKAKGLADAGDYSQACQLFAKAFELERGLGIEFSLADCNEHLGHHALAWHLFRSVAEEGERTGNFRGKLARSRLAALASRVGTVTIKLAEPQLAGLTIVLDGRALVPGPTIREVIDPGSIEVVATAPGHQLFRRSSHVAAGEVVVIDVTLATDAGAPDVAGTTTPPTDATPTPVTPPHDDKPPSPDRRRTRIYLALGTGAVAVASAITGIALAIDAKVRYDNATNDRAHCSPGDPPQCDSIGQAGIDRSQHIAAFATGFGIAAVVLGATATVLYVTAPHDIVVAPTTTGVAIAGRF